MWVIVQPPRGKLNHCLQTGADRTPCGFRAKRWQVIHVELGGSLRPGCRRCRLAFEQPTSPHVSLDKLAGVEAWFVDQFKALRTQNLPHESQLEIVREMNGILQPLVIELTNLLKFKKLMAQPPLFERKQGRLYLSDF
jgi:hypothetical protein